MSSTTQSNTQSNYLEALYAGCFDFMRVYPTVNPLVALGLFVMVPIVSYAYIYVRSVRTHKFLDWKLCLGIYLDDNSSRIALRTIILTILLSLNQICYSYQNNLSISLDPTYYSRTNSAIGDDVEAIILSGSQSFASLSETSRRLSSSDSWIAFVYHTSNFDELLYSRNFEAICHTENNILKKLPCIYSSGIKSIIPSVFNTTSCTQLYGAHQKYSMYENQNYLQDNVNSLEPNSTIVISYFQSNYCNDYSIKSIQSQLSALTVNPIQITVVDDNFIRQDFYNNVVDAYSTSGISILIMTIFLVFGLRGVFTTIAVFYSMLVSIIAAIGFLPHGNYSHFSIYNILSVFMLMSTGVTTVLLYGSAWRRAFPIGAKMTGRRILKSYQFVSLALVFVFLISFITYITKTTSSVVVINQIGLFMAVTFFVYFTLFHTLIIPVWIALSRKAIFPPSTRQKFERLFEIQIMQEYGKDDFYSIGDDNDNFEEYVFYGNPNLTSSNTDRDIEEAINQSLITANENNEAINHIDDVICPGFRDRSNSKPESNENISDSKSRRSSFRSKQASKVNSVSQDDVATTSLRNSQRSKSDSKDDESRNIDTLRLRSLTTESNGITTTLKTSLTRETSNRTQTHGSKYDHEMPNKPSLKMQNFMEYQNLSESKGKSNVTFSDETMTSERKSPVTHLESSQRSSLSRQTSNRSTSPARRPSIQDVMALQKVTNNVGITEPFQSVNEIPTRSRANTRESIGSMISTSGAIITEGSTEAAQRRSIVTQRESVIYAEHNPRKEAKAKARYYGLIAVVFWAFLMVFVGYFGMSDLKLDYTPLELFSTSTNIGRAMYIQKNFKTTLIQTYTDPEGVLSHVSNTPTIVPTHISMSSTVSPTVTPNNQPTFPTFEPAIPTVEPTTYLPTPFAERFSQPTRHTTHKPTIKPTTIKSTEFPSAKPTSYPNIFNSNDNDYYLSGCFGLTHHKEHVDSEVILDWNADNFLDYSLTGGLFNDLHELCYNINEKRESLNINPTWNFNLDCVYNQISEANHTFSSLSDDSIISFLSPYWGTYALQSNFRQTYWNQAILLYWAVEYNQKASLGVENVFYPTVYSPIDMPVWICSNFTIQSTSSFSYSAVTDDINTWKALYSSSSSFANEMKIPIIVGSSIYSKSIFQYALEKTVATSAIVSFFGFTGLIFLFTQNISLTIISSISVFSIGVITVAIKSGTISSTFDLYDVIILITLFGLMLNFVVHFLFNFFNDSDHLKILYYEPDGYEDEIDLLWNLPNSLIYTWRCSLKSFLIPLLMMIAIGGSLVSSSLLLLQKLGQYIVIITIVSTSYTLLLFPFLLGLSYRYSSLDIDWDNKADIAWSTLLSSSRNLYIYIQDCFTFKHFRKFSNYNTSAQSDDENKSTDNVKNVRKSQQPISALDAPQFQRQVEQALAESAKQSFVNELLPGSRKSNIAIEVNTFEQNNGSTTAPMTPIESKLPMVPVQRIHHGRSKKEKDFLLLNTENLERVTTKVSRPSMSYNINSFLNYREDINKHVNVVTIEDESKSTKSANNNADIKSLSLKEVKESAKRIKERFKQLSVEYDEMVEEVIHDPKANKESVNTPRSSGVLKMFVDSLFTLGSHDQHDRKTHVYDSSYHSDFTKFRLNNKFDEDLEPKKVSDKSLSLFEASFLSESEKKRLMDKPEEIEEKSKSISLFEASFLLPHEHKSVEPQKNLLSDSSSDLIGSGNMEDGKPQGTIDSKPCNVESIIPETADDSKHECDENVALAPTKDVSVDDVDRVEEENVKDTNGASDATCGNLEDEVKSIENQSISEYPTDVVEINERVEKVDELVVPEGVEVKMNEDQLIVNENRKIIEAVDK